MIVVNVVENEESTDPPVKSMVNIDRIAEIRAVNETHSALYESVSTDPIIVRHSTIEVAAAIHLRRCMRGRSDQPPLLTVGPLAGRRARKDDDE